MGVGVGVGSLESWRESSNVGWRARTVAPLPPRESGRVLAPCVEQPEAIRGDRAAELWRHREAPRAQRGSSVLGHREAPREATERPQRGHRELPSCGATERPLRARGRTERERSGVGSVTACVEEPVLVVEGRVADQPGDSAWPKRGKQHLQVSHPVAVVLAVKLYSAQRLATSGVGKVC